MTDPVQTVDTAVQGVVAKFNALLASNPKKLAFLMFGAGYLLAKIL